MPTTAAQVDWYFNFFTLDTNARTVIDSLGQSLTSEDYSAPAIDTQTNNFNPIFKATGGTDIPSDPDAQISGGEIDNYP